MTAMGAFLLLLTASAPRAQGSAGPGLFEAGAYSFSDELGGFHITSATGKGTKDDPIVITQELEASSPVTIVIRAVRPIQPFSSSSEVANGFLYLRTEVLNNSGQAWVEFEFELQEVVKRRASSATASPSTSGSPRRTISRPTVLPSSAGISNRTTGCSSGKAG